MGLSMLRKVSILFVLIFSVFVGCSSPAEDEKDEGKDQALLEAERLLDEQISLAEQGNGGKGAEEVAVVAPKDEVDPEGIDNMPMGEEELGPDIGEEVVPEEAPVVKEEPVPVEEPVVKEEAPKVEEKPVEEVKGAQVEVAVQLPEGEPEKSLAVVMSDYYWAQAKDLFRRYDLELQQARADVDGDGVTVTLCFICGRLYDDEEARILLVDMLEDLAYRTNNFSGLANRLPGGAIRGRQFNVSIDFEMNLGRYFEMIFCDRLILKNGCVTYYDYEGKLMLREAYEKAKMLVELEHETDPYFIKRSARTL